MDDCDHCPWKAPKLMEENLDAWVLWNACCTQWNVDFGGIVGLAYDGVFGTAKGLEIKMYPALFRKIQILERFELKRQANNREKDKENKNGVKQKIPVHVIGDTEE